MRLDYVLIGLGLIAVALMGIPAVKHYVPELEDWNWMIEAYVPGDDAHPVFLKFSLSPEVNDLNSLRITEGKRSSERMIPFWLDEHNNVYVYVKRPTTLRLYWGKEDVLPVYGEYEPVEYKPFKDSANLDVYHEGGAWSYPAVHHDMVVVINWDEEAWGRLQYAHTFPSFPVSEQLVIKSSGWGCGAVFIPFEEANYSLLFRLPDDCDDELEFPNVTGVLVLTMGDGKLHIYVLDDGEVITQSTRRHTYVLQLTRYPGGVRVHLPVADVSVDRPLERPAIYYSAWCDGSDKFKLYNWKIESSPEEVSPEFSEVMLAPKRPRIEIISPAEVVPDSNVEIHAEVNDPNNDLRWVKVYLDKNLIVESNEYTVQTYVELNDGEYTLKVKAKDREGALSTQVLRFVVDSQPPEFNIYHEVNDGNIIFDVNATDLTELQCSYILDGEEYPFDCNEFTISLEGCGEHTLQVKVCDSAGHCVSHAFKLGEPCPELAPQIRFVIKEKEVEKPVIVYLGKQTTEEEVGIQPASPILGGGIGAVILGALILFLLFRML